MEIALCLFMDMNQVCYISLTALGVLFAVGAFVFLNQSVQMEEDKDRRKKILRRSHVCLAVALLCFIVRVLSQYFSG